VGNRFTWHLGQLFNSVCRALNKVLRHPLPTDFEVIFDAAWKTITGGFHRFSISVSFGLLLMCIGLVITCLYLLR